ncbi:hypothetical protein F5Y16DRAFT_393930 [Xylariaceae sp. FL0255]|nr:hypothetical protein F5Y16DRAFT_393930 [Xylariaceae sp. FL0255]
MSTHSDSTSGSRPTSRHLETGFPESFAAHTTSRRHPDAIVDPNFSISDEHIDPSKSMQRSRKSLLRKHRRTISKGKITAEDLLNLQDVQPYTSTLSTTDSAIDVAEPKSKDSRASPDSSKQAENMVREAASKEQANAPVSPGFHYTTGRDGEEGRKKTNIFRKWGGQ